MAGYWDAILELDIAGKFNFNRKYTNVCMNKGVGDSGDAEVSRLMRLDATRHLTHITDEKKKKAILLLHCETRGGFLEESQSINLLMYLGIL